MLNIDNFKQPTTSMKKKMTAQTLPPVILSTTSG